MAIFSTGLYEVDYISVANWKSKVEIGDPVGSVLMLTRIFILFGTSALVNFVLTTLFIPDNQNLCGLNLHKSRIYSGANNKLNVKTYSYQAGYNPIYINLKTEKKGTLLGKQVWDLPDKRVKPGKTLKTRTF